MSRIKTFLPSLTSFWAAIAILLKRQNPDAFSRPAWCPGGRTTAKSFCSDARIVRLAASQAASKLFGDSLISARVLLHSQARLILRIYLSGWTRLKYFAPSVVGWFGWSVKSCIRYAPSNSDSGLWARDMVLVRRCMGLFLEIYYLYFIFIVFESFVAGNYRYIFFFGY